MSRPVSPLLHDYKPSARKRPAKSKALQWFAVGLGIPLAGLALITALTTSTPTDVPSEQPIMTATEHHPIANEPLVEAPLTTDNQPDPKLSLETAAPELKLDKLVVTVGRGDTMEKLFRKNNLDLGNLMSIVQLDEARQRFRKIKPGDIFEITHDNGQLVSIYSELDLTSALLIDRQESGFSASVIDRPIEIRKRHA